MKFTWAVGPVMSWIPIPTFMAEADARRRKNPHAIACKSAISKHKKTIEFFVRWCLKKQKIDKMSPLRRNGSST